MNETEIAIMSGLAALREAGVREVPMEVVKLEELYSENARLRAALHFYSDNHAFPNDGPWGVDSNDFGRVARAALEVKP